MRFNRQFVVFVGVGVVCAAFDVAIMQFLIFIGVAYIIATTGGFISGLVANYFLHTRVTFDSSLGFRRFAKFFIVVMINYFLTILFVVASSNWLGSAIVGKLASLPLVAVNGFFLSKHWVYK